MLEQETEVHLLIEPSSGRRFDLILAISSSQSCDDVLECVRETVQELGKHSENSQWNLYEVWDGREKRVPSDCNFMQLLESWVHLDNVCFIARERKLQVKQVGNTDKTRSTSLLYKRLQAKKKEMRKLRLQRVKSGVSIANDPIRKGIQLLATLTENIDSLNSENKQLASEVFEMNHEATRLTEQLTALRKNSQMLSDSLTQLQQEVLTKKKQEEKEKLEKVSVLTEAISTVQNELDRRQRMSELQDTKINLVQEEVLSLQGTLNQKEKELEQMREWAIEKKRKCQRETGLTSNEDSISCCISSTSSIGSEVSDIIPGIKRDRGGSGGSFNKRFEELNKKTKQQVKEEARVFREALRIPNIITMTDQQEIESTDGGIAISSHISSLMDSNLSEITAPKSQSDRDLKKRSSKDDKKEKKGILLKEYQKKNIDKNKRVSFGVEALLLSAAGEGDLETVKQCVHELGSCQVTSSKGATCLHNAVCSGNINIMEYLLYLGCDVNAQDSEGWTPLHCAVGFSHLPAVHLLVHNGASLYLFTSDEQLPIDLVKESVADENDIDSQNCYHYLKDCWTGLGIVNDKKVFALFNYTATSQEELSFVQGEEFIVLQRNGDEGWWKVENAHGITGYVPSTFLGLYPRYQIVL